MNGIEAMDASTGGEKVLAVISQAAGPRGLRVVVKDTGTGFDPETSRRIFDPFFTTKPSGMGMGLSICRAIIEAHGGKIWATPNMPHGAVFEFSLPNDAA